MGDPPPDWRPAALARGVPHATRRDCGWRAGPGHVEGRRPLDTLHSIKRYNAALRTKVLDGDALPVSLPIHRPDHARRDGGGRVHRESANALCWSELPGVS